MMLENNWEKCLFHLHWHRKGRNCWLAIRYVFRTHLFYYLVSKGRAAAFSLLWQTWASTFYSKICTVLIESGAFLPPAPRPFLLSINIHNMQFSGQFWVKIIWSQKGQVGKKNHIFPECWTETDACSFLTVKVSHAAGRIFLEQRWANFTYTSVFKIHGSIDWPIFLNTSIWVHEKVQRDLASQVRLCWAQKFC